MTDSQPKTHQTPIICIKILFLLVVLYTQSLSESNTCEEYLICLEDSIYQKMVMIPESERILHLKNRLNLPPQSDIIPMTMAGNNPLGNWFLLRIRSITQEQMTAVADLSMNQILTHFQNNNRLKIHNLPDDPLFSQQWYHQKLQTTQSWDHAQINPDIIMAVIDTGIDYLHPDLQGSLWTNDTEDLNGNGILDSEDINGIDDDQNGYIDDVVGWDFTDAPRFADGGDYRQPDNDPQDEYAGGHGTKIAGIIAAQTNNAIGISGLIPGGTVMNLRAGTAAGYLEEDDVARAVLYAIHHGARIINMSFGDVIVSRFLKDVIKYAYSQGVIIVASAGNSGNDQVYYPAGLPETIAVGATNQNDQLAGFSNYGQLIDLVAPGVDILTTKADGGYDTANGTSFSAPMVTAAVGLLLSIDPDYSPEQIRNLLKSSTDDLGLLGWDDYFGAGRLNLLNTSLGGFPASLTIHRPSSGTYLAADTLDVIVTAQDPDLFNVRLDYGIGRNPTLWIPIVEKHSYQIISDTLANLSLEGFADTTIVLRLQLTKWNRQITEYRSLFHLDRTAPEIVSHQRINLLDEDRYVALIDLETDDLTNAQIFYRLRNQDDEFISVAAPYETRSHQFILRETGQIEYYLKIRNLSGLNLIDDNGGLYYVHEIPSDNFLVNDYVPNELSLESGFMYPFSTDLDDDGHGEIIISHYDAFRSFGSVGIYEIDGNRFVKRLETPFNAIPRDVGDADSDGKSELLLGYGQNSYLMEAEAVDEWPSVVVWSDTGAFWAGRIADLDRDGKNEILGKSGKSFVMLEKTVDNQFREVFVFTNPSTGDNQLGPPRIEISDLDADGFTEIIYGDYDGDLIIYENIADDQFESRGSMRLPLSDATNYFIVDSVSFDGEQVLIAGSNSGEDADYEHEFAARYWNFSLIRATANNSYQISQNIPVYGFAGIKDFDSGLNAQRSGHDKSGSLFLAIYPDLYEFRVNNGQLVPFWYRHEVNTNTVLFADFDYDNQNEIYFNDGYHIVGFRNLVKVGPRPPSGVSARPLDTAAIKLQWHAAEDANDYLINRGLTEHILLPYDSVAVPAVAYIDSNVITGIRYYYRLQTRMNQQDPKVSRMGDIVNAIPNPQPLVDTLLVRNNYQIEIYFNEMMDKNRLLIKNFQLTETTNSVSSAIPFLNYQAVLLSFSDNFESGTTYQLELIALQDTNRTALHDEDKSQFFTYDDQQAYKPYVKNWYFEGENEIVLQFNQAMDPETVLQPDNYKMEPAGRVINVQQIQSSLSVYRLEMSEEISLAGRGITVYLKLINLRSASGILMEEGSRFALIKSPTSIDGIYVFPQPLRISDDVLYFANVAYGTSIKIYNLNGQFITGLEEEDQNGGIRWDLRDQYGMKVSSGIYLYQATFQNEKKLGKFTIVK